MIYFSTKEKNRNKVSIKQNRIVKGNQIKWLKRKAEIEEKDIKL